MVGHLATETGWRSATYRKTCISSRPIVSRLRAIDESLPRTVHLTTRVV